MPPDCEPHSRPQPGGRDGYRLRLGPSPRAESVSHKAMSSQMLGNEWPILSRIVAIPQWWRSSSHPHRRPRPHRHCPRPPCPAPRFDVATGEHLPVPEMPGRETLTATPQGKGDRTPAMSLCFGRLVLHASPNGQSMAGLAVRCPCPPPPARLPVAARLGLLARRR